MTIPLKPLLHRLTRISNRPIHKTIIRRRARIMISRPNALESSGVVVVVCFWAEFYVLGAFAPLAGAEPAEEGTEGGHAGGY